MIKYVFFDFNGTILDDVDLCLNLLNEFLAEQGKKQLNLAKYRHVFTFPIKKYYELAGIDFNKASFATLSERFIKKYQPLSYECRSYPYVRETILELKKQGYQVGVLSASEVSNLTKQLEILGLKDELSFILGLNNIFAASKIEVAKDFLIKEKISAKDCLLVGDTDHDFEVAQSLGMKCILFAQGHQARDVLEKTKMPIIDNIKEIFKYLD